MSNYNIPRFNIDWDQVGKLAEAGAKGVEICGHLGINESTLYRKCQEDHNMHWSEWRLSKFQKGNSLLKAKQMQVAMSGNVTMLIWLGKQRLEQGDKHNESEGALNVTVVNFNNKDSNSQEEIVLEDLRNGTLEIEHQ